MNYWKKQTALVMMLTLSALSICCATYPKKEKSETKLINVYIPTFPEPVDSEGVYIAVLDEEAESVTIPYWYWMKIVQYALKVESAANIIEEYNKQ